MTTKTTDNPATGAAEAHRAVTADIEALGKEAGAAQERLAAAQAEARRLDREQMAATMALQARERERRLEVHRATLNLGQDYTAKFQAEGDAALADFRREVAATPWGAALIRWQVAQGKHHYWAEASNAAMRQVNPSMASQAIGMHRPDVTPELVIELITKALNAEINDGVRRFNTVQSDHQTRYARGEIDDPTPPVE